MTADPNEDGETLEEAEERALDHSTRAENDWAEYGPNGPPSDDPDEIDWLNPARHPNGPPNQVAPVRLECDIVSGYCLVHECPSWQCDEQP